ncbi:MAG: NAD-dependent epimerase/dehydratase family protein [Flavobacteriales bacterium]
MFLALYRRALCSLPTMLLQVAVTGASGHIGNVVCRTLLERGHRVRAMYKADDRALAGLPLERVQGDVLVQEDLLRLLRGCDVVVNCAAIISVAGDPTGMVYRTNTEGPRNVRAAAVVQGAKRMVHISSVHAVTELPHSQPYDETRPYKTAARYVYDRSKALGEQALFAAIGNDALELVVLRPSAVIGPFDAKPSMMGAALLDFRRGKVPVLPPGGYDLVDVRDVARSIVEAIDKGRNGEVYILSGKYHTMKKLAQVIARVTGKRMPQRVMSHGLLKALLPFVALHGKITRTAPRFNRASIDALVHGHPNIDSTKARKELGHTTRPLEETLRDFYRWQKEQGVID